MRLRLPLPTVLVSIAGAALLGLLAYGVTNQAPNRTLDEAIAQGHHPMAPDAHMALPRLFGGGRTTLASYRGKVVLLNFWASWCVDCQDEAPVMRRAQRELSRHGGTVLGVTYQDTSTDSQRFVREYHVAYPNLRDPNGELVHDGFGTDQLPESFLINRRGRLVDIERGPIGNSFVKRAVALAEAEA